MKRILALAAVMLLLLSACSGNESPAATSTEAQSTTVPPEVVSNYIGEGLAVELRMLADNAVAVARDIYSHGSLPCGDTPVLVGGKDYYPVSSGSLKSYAELEAFINSVFTPEAAQALLAGGKYIESDGAFLCDKSAYAANSEVDLTRGSYTVSLNRSSEDEIIITIAPAGATDSLTLTAVNTDGNWRIKAPLDISELTGGNAQ